MPLKFLMTVLLLLLVTGSALAQGTIPSADAPSGFTSWDDVLAQANGQTINYLYGGSDAIP